MASSGTAQTLRRIADQARTSQFAAQGDVSPAKALQDAFRRAGEEELQLLVSAGDVKESYVTAVELVESLPEQAFLGVLLGPECGTGLFCFEADALSAVIEMRTMGRVFQHSPQPRRTTKTDAAMVADLIDRVLAEFEAPLLETEAARWASGWRYQLFLADPRPLSVVLEEGTHRLLEVEVSFAGGTKTGKVLIAVPATGRASPQPASVPEPETNAGRMAEEWSRTLGETVGNVEVALNVALGRVRLPLEGLSDLTLGDRIVFPSSALKGIKLVAAGGDLVAEGHLGQSGGRRAVKILQSSQPIAPLQPEGSVVSDEMFKAHVSANTGSTNIVESIMNMTPNTPETLSVSGGDAGGLSMGNPDIAETPP